VFPASRRDAGTLLQPTQLPRRPPKRTGVSRGATLEIRARSEGLLAALSPRGFRERGLPQSSPRPGSARVVASKTPRSRAPAFPSCPPALAPPLFPASPAHAMVWQEPTRRRAGPEADGGVSRSDPRNPRTERGTFSSTFAARTRPRAPAPPCSPADAHQGPRRPRRTEWRGRRPPTAAPAPRRTGVSRGATLEIRARSEGLLAALSPRGFRERGLPQSSRRPSSPRVVASKTPPAPAPLHPRSRAPFPRAHRRMRTKVPGVPGARNGVARAHRRRAGPQADGGVSQSDLEIRARSEGLLAALSPRGFRERGLPQCSPRPGSPRVVASETPPFPRPPT
jgi:hypothetical protein